MRQSTIRPMASALLLATSLTVLPVQAQPPQPALSFPILQSIQLTPAQQQQVASIREATRSQINTVLTPQQKQQVITAFQSGTPMQTALQTLNLTDRQRQQLRQIFGSAFNELRALLTPQQRQQLRQVLRDRLQADGQRFQFSQP